MPSRIQPWRLNGGTKTIPLDHTVALQETVVDTLSEKPFTMAVDSLQVGGFRHRQL
ncbi:MAG TPA: hypothetical protein VGY31_01385 [Terriglobia bacterium]|nr:hypothetical protein [Terriglobia bacterium]